MDDSTFLKMIFDGYVNYYGALRWHTNCRDSDMTQMELSFFSDLGFKLGFISKREHIEEAPPNHTYNGPSNPRDLVWFDRSEDHWIGHKGRINIFLHLERENERNLEMVTDYKNKLKDSARFPDERYLIGVFGWVTEDDLNEIRNVIREDAYNDRNILIIAWIGPDKEHTDKVVGLVCTKDGRCYERCVLTDMDKGGFWYLYSDPNGKWRQMHRP